MEKERIQVFLIVKENGIRDYISTFIQQNEDFKNVGTASDGIKGLKLLPHANPHVIIMGYDIASENNFEIIKIIMSNDPIPIILISNKKQDLENSLEAISKGALEFLYYDSKKLISKEFEVELNKSIKMVSEVKLITRRVLKDTTVREIPPPMMSRRKIDAIIIGASLGGPPAIAEILSHLPSNFPVPIFIVQHISLGFVKGLVDWLQEYSKLKVEIAKNNEKVKTGTVYVAPDDAHLEIGIEGVIKLVKKKNEKELCPSVDHLFSSALQIYENRTIAIILTGMGKDGAEELLHLKKKGAYTIAQDESSSLMFGMPKAAIELKAASEILPLKDIADRLIQLVMG